MNHVVVFTSGSPSTLEAELSPLVLDSFFSWRSSVGISSRVENSKVGVSTGSSGCFASLFSICVCLEVTRDERDEASSADLCKVEMVGGR